MNYRDVLMVALAFLVAWAGTGALRAYALRRKLIDVPNARSSHTVPTPRGGGVAIVLSFLVMYVLWHCLVSHDSSKLLLALVPGGVAVALIGFWDDHSSLPAKLRFFVHLLAAAWAVYWLGGWGTLDLGFARLSWGWLGAVVAIAGLAWSINLYNFMDGIDGLAGSEAVFAGCVGGVLIWHGGGQGMPLWLLAGASAGFLVLNWPPARIFMGDAGSGFLGYAFGVVALHSTVSGTTTLWPWLILLGVFVVDATLTLLRRALRGICVTDAHRTHAYQWASRRAGGHQPVTVCALGINALLAIPATLATVWPQSAVVAAVASMAALGMLAWKFNAGLPETTVISEQANDIDGRG